MPVAQLPKSCDHWFEVPRLGAWHIWRQHLPTFYSWLTSCNSAGAFMLFISAFLMFHLVLSGLCVSSAKSADNLTKYPWCMMSSSSYFTLKIWSMDFQFDHNFPTYLDFEFTVYLGFLDWDSHFLPQSWKVSVISLHEVCLSILFPCPFPFLAYAHENVAELNCVL